jgi:hypothetical protein
VFGALCSTNQQKLIPNYTQKIRLGN